MPYGGSPVIDHEQERTADTPEVGSGLESNAIGAPAMPGRLRVMVLHSRYSSGAVSGENRVVDDEIRLLQGAGHAVMGWSPEIELGARSGQIRAGLEAVWSVTAQRELRSRVRRFRPDVIHCHNLFPAFSPSVLRATRVPVVVTLHNYRLLCLPSTFLRDGVICEACHGRSVWQGVVHRCYRGSLPASAALGASLTVHRAAATFRRASRYLAVSAFVRDKHVAAGFSPRAITVKPNFSWPADRRVGPGEYFLAVGRLSTEKGFQTAVRAWDEAMPAKLVVAGDGPLRSDLQAGAPSNVEFLGAVPPDRVPALIARARAVIVPSICYEGSPRSVTEAYGSGVPVIASRLGAIPEVVDEDVTGVLVPPSDPTRLRAAVLRLTDDALCRGLGDAAYAAWEQLYGPERAIRNLELAYQSVTRTRSPV
jgi:glycosyltransferase involved in cell wall biosynthesis